MQHFVATYIPISKEGTIVKIGEAGKTINMELDAFGLIDLLKPGDDLWCLMGSTNAAVTAGAFRRGIRVHQLSYQRALAVLHGQNGKNNGKKAKISEEDVNLIREVSPEIFYALTPAQAEVLEISAALQDLLEAMEVRESYANIRRASICARAVIYGKALGREIPTKEALKKLLNEELGNKDDGGRKKQPNDQRLQFLMDTEDQAGKNLGHVIKGSGIYEHIFASVDGVGSRLAARFIAAIERIERFERSEDLSNFAGILPRGSEGKLPSKKNSAGKMLSRKPELNMACFLFQDQIFTYGRNSYLGQMLIKQVEAECPCTAEERKKDPELRKKYSDAVKKARIATTRHLLEKIIWPRWREYMGLQKAS